MWKRSSTGTCLLLGFVAAGLFACTSQDKQLDEIQQKIRGLIATTHTVSKGWLQGDLSGTYVRTAFQQTLQLVDKQRSTLNESPALLLDPRGASLSRAAEQLSRALASLIEDVKRDDAASAREHVAQVPAVGAQGAQP